MSVIRHSLLTVQKKAEKQHTRPHTRTHTHTSKFKYFFLLAKFTGAIYPIEWYIESINRIAVFGCGNCCCQMIIKIKWLNDSIRINDVHLA